MRKLNFTLLAVIAATVFTFTSCEKNEDSYLIRTVGFESATLPTEGYLLGSVYSESGITFHHEYDVEYGSWKGFTVSNNTDKNTAGVANQFSVYGDSGAGSSNNFAVSSVYGECEFRFDNKSERIIESAYLNNSTYATLSMLNGDDFSRKFKKDDWFLLTLTGYDSAGNKTASKDVYLADYRGAMIFTMSEWSKVNLSSLGKVNKVSFSLSSTDNSEWDGNLYMNTPAYFCIDNIAYREYAEKK